jgi:ABC-2 type transport system permease protein
VEKMSSFWTVFFFNYLAKIKSKTFIITTILFTVLIIGLMNVEKIIDLFKPDSKPVGVITQDKELQQIISHMTEDRLEISGHEHKFKYFKDERKARDQLKDEELAYLLSVQQQSDGMLKVKFLANTDVHDEDVTVVSNIFSKIQSYLVASNLQLANEDFLRMMSPVEVEVEKSSSKLKNAEEHMGTGFLIILFISVNYILILSYSTQLATAVASEKSSRVMELIVSSISPTKYLFAKLSSTLLIGLTQVAVWITVPYLLYKAGIVSIDDSTSAFINFSNIDMSLILFGILLFVLGFLLYGSFACLFGSLMSRSEESSQAVMPLMIILLIAFYIGIFGLQNPGSKIITVTSHIPFFTPIIMLVRLGFLEISYVEVLISVISLSVLTFLAILVTTKVFKGGVVLYGEGSLKNIKKALEVHQN